jgi:hypothetical protein
LTGRRLIFVSCEIVWARRPLNFPILPALLNELSPECLKLLPDVHRKAAPSAYRMTRATSSHRSQVECPICGLWKQDLRRYAWQFDGSDHTGERHERAGLHDLKALTYRAALRDPPRRGETSDLAQTCFSVGQ